MLGVLLPNQDRVLDQDHIKLYYQLKKAPPSNIIFISSLSLYITTPPLVKLGQLFINLGLEELYKLLQHLDLRPRDKVIPFPLYSKASSRSYKLAGNYQHVNYRHSRVHLVASPQSLVTRHAVLISLTHAHLTAQVRPCTSNNITSIKEYVSLHKLDFV